MPLPDLIEIVPLTKPVRAEITVPGSKSITNRALILAALAKGEVTLTGALWSEDTQVMTEALQTLGFEVCVENDPTEFCNRTIRVQGQGGRIPRAGTAGQPLELFVGNAGTAARFLAAMVCLGHGVYRLSGVPRMHERPQAALFKALRELGYRVDSPNDKLPATIFGRDAVERVPAERSCTVSIEESSQFASALLLCAQQGHWGVKVVGENAEESPYVAMTAKLIEAFPNFSGNFRIEADASSGSYFWAAQWLANHYETEAALQVALEALGRPLEQGEYISLKFDTSETSIAQWPVTDWQIDADFKRISWPQIPSELSRRFDLGDSIMTLIALSPAKSSAPVRFTDLGRLRHQECERVVALRTELTKCGAKVIEEGDTLTVYPSQLHGAEIETYHDHRMAMCFAILGLKVPGIRLKNPSCVKKTFPNFFQKLASPPPNGLGVEIWEVQAGRRTRKLDGEDLFAE
jgi:3-phosphoshikimate 1-carboxyvinyltransferase